VEEANNPVTREEIRKILATEAQDKS
jgi:hypothetical protein